jgi:hypothetical protein
MSRCKKCGAAIIFVRTPNGKLMPCDSQAVQYRENEAGKGRIVKDNGQVVKCDTNIPADQATGTGWLPHWASCPGANACRKR